MAVRRMALVLVIALAVALVPGACAPLPPLAVTYRAAVQPPVVLPGDDASAASVAASERLLEASDVIFLASASRADDLAETAVATGAPLLIAGPGVADELARLGATSVVALAGDDLGTLNGQLERFDLDPAVPPAEQDLPAIEVTQPAPPVVLLTDSAAAADVSADATAAAETVVRAASGTTADLPGGDPRRSSETVATASAHAGATVLALGDSFGATPLLAERFTAAATEVELPGGGQIVFPTRMFVALYGHPGVPVLGELGEQDLDWAVTRARERAAQFQALTDRTVVPAFEIIATVAAGAAGDDGNYSNEVSVETLRPWVERAGEEGMYVVLDLQPGLSSFPEQARLYEELLVLPHVGLALDPEWRLLPGQRHLEQIGSVDAAEINETLDWLAELTAAHALPQKVVVLHQFTRRMIRDRAQLDTAHDELALVLHVDGNGTQAAKLETWNALLRDLPAGIAMGWKNFIDEDHPMLDPAATMAIEPTPVFVSYQ
ncbi:hypothetical protein SAMN04487783_2476 [Agrococcus baldri]|uniref:Lipoprotein n=1 Tax=Agrococcus baldri TaxID=153730 RepID=A0AA94L0F7_9MICO|nr:hypothetical protein [Agrococcus baldri]SFS17996.1 hypothetical protein SAMN04487783_2476 [Agrococcus baldri]